MKSSLLIGIAASTIAAFGMLLAVGVGTSAYDRTNDLESKVDDLDGRIYELEKRREY